MAILWVRKKLGRGTGVDERGQQEFSTEYTVKSSVPNENRSLILNCGMLPVYGAPHPENLTAICVSVRVIQSKDSPHHWDAVAEWKVNPTSKRDPVDNQKQPDQRREKWSFRGVLMPLSMFCDLDGKLLASSAGQPFDPVMQIQLVCDELTVQRYELECRRGQQRGWINCANSGAWNGLAAGTALVENIVANDEYLYGSYWWNTTYSILYKPRFEMTLPKGAAVKLPDMGTLQWAEVNGETKLVPITRVDPISNKPFYDGRPAYLDGAGKELPRDSSGIYTQDPVFGEFRMKNKFNFADMLLNKPDTLTMV
jgi:hypothetical protein